MKPKFTDLMRSLRDKRMFITFLMGFSSGLPYMLIADNIALWTRTQGIDLKTIGYLGWMTLPFSMKFLWSFLMDRFSLNRLGRRRSWLLMTQIGLAVSLFGLGTQDPSLNLTVFAMWGVLTGFLSASQDIAVDAYRREILKDEEQAIGATLYNYGYRIAVLVASGFGVWIVSPNTLNFTFGQSFQLMAGLMLIGIIATLWANEPKEIYGRPKTLKQSIVEPLAEFFTRPHSLWLIAFIVLYKLGDAMAGKMLSPYYIDLGFQLDSLAITRKAVGLYSSISGLALGGLIVYWVGLYRSLWIFGVFQALSTITFAIMVNFGPKLRPLAIVMSIEDLTAGMGTAALMAFIALLTNQRFTATQFALLSSLATVGRNFFAGFSGKIIESLSTEGDKLSGYPPFFLLCGCLAIPGMLCLIPLRKTDLFK